MKKRGRNTGEPWEILGGKGKTQLHKEKMKQKKETEGAETRGVKYI